jgi:CHAT domain-containing protein/Tfp pilus assembly protein PilF
MKWAARFTAIVPFALLVFAQEPSSQVVRLSPDVPAETKLEKDTTAVFEISVPAQHYLRVRIAPSIDGMKARLIAPSGAVASEAEDSDSDDGQFAIATIADTPGIYRLNVTNGTASAREFRVAILGLRPTQPGDTKRIEADAAAREGRRLRGAQAIPIFQRELDLRRAAQDFEGEARALDALADANHQKRDFPKAIEYRKQALELSHAVESERWKASVLRKLGDSYSQTGRFTEAREQFESALALQQSSGDVRGQAITLNSLAFVYYVRGDLQKSVDLLRDALPLRRQSGDVRGEAYTLHSIGTIYLSMAEHGNAIEYLQQALTKWRVATEKHGEGTTLNSLAMVYSGLADQQKALEYLKLAIRLDRESGDRRSEAATLNNFGSVYALLGDFESSIDYQKQSLAIQQAIHDIPGEANGLANLGTAYRKVGDRQTAIRDYQRALELQVQIGDRAHQGVTLSHLGSVYQELRDSQRAMDYYDRALSLSRGASDRTWEGVTLTRMGSLYYSLGDLEKARECEMQAQGIFHATGARNYEARALYWVARTELAQGQLEAALDNSLAAVNAIESIRSAVGRRDLQSSFFATAHEQYELEIDIMMQLDRQHPDRGWNRKAFEAYERARARGLLDLLSELQADVRKDAPAALVEREHLLENALDAKTDRQARLMSGPHTQPQVQAADAEIRKLLDQYQELEAQIRKQSPQYADVMQAEPATLGEIQQRALDTNTLLLAYALGEDRSYLWAVNKGAMVSFELPKRADIERLARAAYESWSQNAPPSDGRDIASLSRMLLGAVAPQLGRKRLLITGEGAIQYLPFGALIAPGGRRLVQDHEIVTTPSGSALVALQRKLDGRTRAPKAIVAFADPVYGANDPRVNAPKSGETPAFERLRNSRVEADSIVALWPRSSLRAVDFAANRTLATSGVLAEYRMIHFATHGVLNSQHPELSGIALSMVDQNGNAQSGFLRAHEIFNLKLSADLVVLSACQTALGKDVQGEGLMGLARGFFYAGAARVVSSLWAVPDAGTSEFMAVFYRRMRDDHLSPAAALRAAQLAMLQDVRWRDPYYWAAFTIQGEYR